MPTLASGAERSAEYGRSHTGLALGVALLSFVAAACAGVWALDLVAFNPHSDEGVYRLYMRRISEGGLAQYPSLFREFTADPERWMLPPPHRVLHVLLCAVAAKLVGPSFEALTYVSLASHLLTVAVNFFGARRVAGDARAALYSMALACSPLLLRLGVLPLSDATGMLFATFAFWTFLALLDAPSRRRWWVFVVSFALAIAAKELNGLLAAPFLAVAVAERSAERAGLHPRDLAVALSLPLVMVAGLWMLVGWSATAAFQSLRLVLESTASNPYMLENNSGPWYRYLVDFLALTPFATLLALGGVGLVAARASATGAARAALVLGAALLVEASFFGKNVRYFPVFELPLRIAAVEFALAVTARRRFLAPLAIAALAAISIADLWDATHTFRWLHDPITSELLRLRGVLGPR